MEGYYLKLNTFILYSLSYSHILTLHYNSFKGRLSSFISPKGINHPLKEEGLQSFPWRAKFILMVL